MKITLSKSAKPQSNEMIERANDNINHLQHRITGFTPNKIKDAVLENDEKIFNKAQEKEL